MPSRIASQLRARATHDESSPGTGFDGTCSSSFGSTVVQRSADGALSTAVMAASPGGVRLFHAQGLRIRSAWIVAYPSITPESLPKSKPRASTGQACGADTALRHTPAVAKQVLEAGFSVISERKGRDGAGASRRRFRTPGWFLGWEPRVAPRGYSLAVPPGHFGV
jgi:hypothetical protein